MMPLLCYVSTSANHRGKLDNRAKKRAFLGHKAGMKGFVAYDLSSREIPVSRHVIFYEYSLVFHKLKMQQELLGNT